MHSARLLGTVLGLLASADTADGFGSQPNPSCLDQDGNFVSWWFMYKTPNGDSAAYFDPHSRASVLDPSMSLSDPNGPLLRTLNMLKGTKNFYDVNGNYNYNSTGRKQSTNGASGNTSGSDDVTYLMYNDEPDQGNPGSNYGHCKGVLGVSGSNGMWLLHSTPKFPSTDSGPFTWQSGENIYGQTFVCMSLDFPANGGDVETVAQHMLYIKPNTYFQNIAASAQTQSPSLGLVVNKKWVFAPGTWHKRFTPSTSRMYFDTFGKNTNWNDDLWGDLVAPFYSSGLIVESWIRGQALGPYCPKKDKTHPYEVVDAQTLSVGSTQFSETNDHAKWAITTGSAAPNIVCIGDINRMTSQRKRGGGAVCLLSSNLAAALKATVATSDSCDKMNITYDL